MNKKETRRDFLRKAGLGTAALMMPQTFFCGSVQRRPNILFIMTDDHANNAISSYGSKINTTPNIDRIGKEGVRFNNCFCTNSICAPSRAVILTGKYSHLNDQIDNGGEFDSSQMTFPKLLQNAGYETAIIGKWHLKSNPEGFDYWNVLPGQGHYYNPDFIEMGIRKNHTGYSTNLITDFSLEWLRNRSKKPFFLMLHHKAPHRNWMPGPEHLTMYDGVNIPVPETFFDDYSTRCAAAKEQEMTIANHMNYAYDLKIPAEEGKKDLNWGEKAMNRLLDRMTEKQRKAKRLSQMCSISR